MRYAPSLILAAALACAAAVPDLSAAPAPRFYRGMIHAHTCWSDGRALPEQAVAAYRDGGYDIVIEKNADFGAELNLDRKCTFVALGGGVTGYLVGFDAAI